MKLLIVNTRFFPGKSRYSVLDAGNRIVFHTDSHEGMLIWMDMNNMKIGYRILHSIRKFTRMKNGSYGAEYRLIDLNT